MGEPQTVLMAIELYEKALRLGARESGHRERARARAHDLSERLRVAVSHCDRAACCGAVDRRMEDGCQHWLEAGWKVRAREVAIRRTVLAKSRSGGPRAREVAIIMLAMAMTAATVRVRFSPLSPLFYDKA